MTWEEFTQMVEAQLPALGVDSHVQIDLIHVVQPRLQGPYSLRVGLDPVAGLVKVGYREASEKSEYVEAGQKKDKNNAEPIKSRPFKKRVVAKVPLHVSTGKIILNRPRRSKGELIRPRNHLVGTDRCFLTVAHFVNGLQILRLANISITYLSFIACLVKA